MSSFDEQQFERFLAEGERQRKIEEDTFRTEDRLRPELEARGINFGRSGQGEAEETFRNNVILRSLALTVAFVADKIEVSGPDEIAQSDMKKRLQASHLVRGFGGPWLEIIDREIPGESLSEEDTALISEVAINTIMLGEQASAWFAERSSQMKSLLEQGGVAELTQSQETALAQLAILSQDVFGNPNPQRLIEDARRILFDNDLTDEAWQKLLENFFGGGRWGGSAHLHLCSKQASACKLDDRTPDLHIFFENLRRWTKSLKANPRKKPVIKTDSFLGATLRSRSNLFYSKLLNLPRAAETSPAARSPLASRTSKQQPDCLLVHCRVRQRRRGESCRAVWAGKKCCGGIFCRFAGRSEPAGGVNPKPKC